MYPNDMTDGEYARVYGWRQPMDRPRDNSPMFDNGPDGYFSGWDFDNGPDGYSMARDNTPLFNQPFNMDTMDGYLRNIKNFAIDKPVAYSNDRLGDLWDSYQRYVDNVLNRNYISLR